MEVQLKLPRFLVVLIKLILNLRDLVFQMCNLFADRSQCRLFFTRLLFTKFEKLFVKRGDLFQQLTPLLLILLQ
jgi:hypothetical protein